MTGRRPAVHSYISKNRVFRPIPSGPLPPLEVPRTASPLTNAGVEPETAPATPPPPLAIDVTPSPEALQQRLPWPYSLPPPKPVDPTSKEYHSSADVYSNGVLPLQPPWTKNVYGSTTSLPDNFEDKNDKNGSINGDTSSNTLNTITSDDASKKRKLKKSNTLLKKPKGFSFKFRRKSMEDD